MSTGIVSLDEAFAEAIEEASAVPLADEEAVEPTAESESDASAAEHVDESVTDQPDVAESADTDDMQSLVDSMVDETKQEEGETGGEAEPAAVDLTSVVEVDLGDGVERTTIDELVKGNMRQRDYTQKTQKLAATQKDAEDAIEFVSRFREDPIGFARALAERAGLTVDSDTPAADVDVAVSSQEQIEAEVERRLAERLAEDPKMQQATAVAAREAVNAEFDRIEGELNVTITRELRQSLVDEGARRGIADLELLFKAKLADAQRSRSSKRGASTARPTTSPVSAPAERQQESYDSIEAAFESAIAEAGG